MRRIGVALVCCGVVCIVRAQSAPGSAQEALLEVSVNGEKQTDWSLLEIGADGTLWVRRADLQRWGIQLAEGSPLARLAADAFLRLNQVPGVSATVDRAVARLDVKVQPALLRGHEYTAGAAAPVPTRSPPGAFVNYDVSATRTAGADLLRAATEAGVVAGNWVARSEWSTTAQSGSTRSLRLDSNLTADFPRTRTSLQLGDTFARLGTNADAVRVGGVSWGTDFSVTPTFITVPLPNVSNLTAAPGTVELYVNGAKTQQLNVPGGPFTIAQVPVTTGAGELTVVTHDLLGRTQTLTQSYYISPQMLQAGLSAWDAQLGAKREGYGMQSSDYRGILAAAGERYGVTNQLTAQWRVEGDETGGAVSAQWLVLTPHSALVTVAPSCSAVAGTTGCLLDLAYERDSLAHGYGIDVSAGTPHYTPVAAALRAVPQRFQVFSHAQAILPHAVSVTLGGTWREEVTGAHTVSMNLALGKTLRNKGHLDFGFSRFSGPLSSSYVTLIYTQSLGAERSVSATAYVSDGQAGGAATLQKSLPAGDGYGYTLRAAQDTVTSVDAVAQWNRDAVAVSGLVQRQGDQSALGVEMTGAVLWFDHAVFLARRINESFAVVDAPGLAGIPVYLNGQVVSHLDADGHAVLPDVRPYESNKVALDLARVPLSLNVAQAFFDVVPYRRGGAVVAVPVHLAATVRLRLPDGAWVPAGARVVEAHGSTPVGTDGTAFFEGARGDNTLDVRWSEGHCRTHLKLPTANTNRVDLACAPY